MLDERVDGSPVLARVRVDVLGPLRVHDRGGRDLTPSGALQRRLLALLVLHRDRSVDMDVLVDALWPTGAPRDPVAAVHNHVFRLRRVLPPGALESTADGYRLSSAAIDLDADRLAAVVAGGAGGASSATDEIADLLARWRGAAYAELADVDDGRVEAGRLEDLRTRALELSIEHRISSGATDGLIVELASLVDAEPLRERPRALLMSALAASGRHVEALRVFDDFRRLLGDELGIEPSPSLTAQHAALLAGAGHAVWVPATRLPNPVTSLVGRDALVLEVADLVEHHRLVTLVGPGGVGKTRLVVEVGHRLRAARPDRPVVMCELATADEETAVDVVAAALAIDARPGIPLAERVATVLGDAEIVVLLDNCEHVVVAVADVVDHLLAACPNVTVVATSRERLRIAGEHVSVVPPLSSYADDAPAVQLFVDRARAVAPAFAPDAGELAVVADIVRRLDGLPLAIELAAARLHTHDVVEVAEGLDDRTLLLTPGYRTSSRHGSLRAAMAWSFGLLDEPLRRAFSSVSVFAGPFTADDAAAVCDTDVATVASDLLQLAERSLVMRAPGRRYVLLETLRSFGAEQLADAGLEDEARGRHARYYVRWVEVADRRLRDPGFAVVSEIDERLPELRAALGWLLDHAEVELAGRLVASLLDYGLLRLRPDVLAWAERVTAADGDDRSPFAPVVWAVSAYAAWMAGDVAESGARTRRALDASARHGGRVPSEASTIRANHALFQGRLDEAVHWYSRASAAAADDPTQRMLVEATRLLALAYANEPSAAAVAARLIDGVGDECSPMSAYVWFCAGEADLRVDVERARARFARALHLADVTNAAFVTGLAGASKASIDARTGDPLAAAEEYRWLLMHWRRAGMWSTQWTMLRSIAGLLERLDRPRDAAVLEGAVRTTRAGHRIFGDDERALAQLGGELREVLGDEDYEAARAEGAVLDGDAAVEHALRSLSVGVTTSAGRR